MKKIVTLTLFILISYLSKAQKIPTGLSQSSIKYWTTTGNTGITNSNFIGTIDAQPLKFKIKNLPSGIIDSAKGSTALGYLSLSLNIGNWNTAFGFKSLSNNSTGTQNTAIGVSTLRSNTTGFNNSVMGSYSLEQNTTGYDNTSMGFYSLLQNTTGFYNSAFGSFSLKQNTTGVANTANGFHSLEQNTTGSNNTASGVYALEQNTTGTNNTSIGAFSLYRNDSGYANCGFGDGALYNNTRGNNNTASGFQALFSNTTGYNNSAIGSKSLNNNTTGYNNTSIGYDAIVSTGNLNNATAIGAFARVDASNKVRIGNGSVTSIGGQVGWTNFSDGRIKKNFKENVPGLKFINLLKPKTYNYDISKENAILGIAEKMNGEFGDKDIEKINFSGFVAQEVESAANKINYDFSGIDKTGKLMGLRYSEFVVPLVKSVQELSVFNDENKADINDLISEIEQLKSQIEQLKVLISTQQSSSNPKEINNQNTQIKITPNPTNCNAILSTPNNSEKKSMLISDASGKLVWEKTTTDKNIIIPSQNFAKGIYLISVLINGKTETLSMMKN